MLTLATVIPHAWRSYLELARVDAHVVGRGWRREHALVTLSLPQGLKVAAKSGIFWDPELKHEWSSSQSVKMSHAWAGLTARGSRGETLLTQATVIPHA